MAAHGFLSHFRSAMGEKEMNKATILIVEDNAILALDLQGMISRLGYRWRASRLRRGCYCLPVGQRVDLVLMDIELAGDLNGIATAEIFINHLISLLSF